MTELEQEFLQLVQKLVFEMRFAHHLPGLQAEELEDIGIADRQTRLCRLGAGLSERGQLRLVTRQAGTLEVERGDLPFQLAHGPVAADALGFVEGAFERVFDRQKLRDMGERQLGDQFLPGEAGFGSR